MLMFDLQGVQKAVDAVDQLVTLACQVFIRIDVGVLLYLSGHQPLGVLRGATHQILQLPIQLLDLSNLQKHTWERFSKQQLI